MILKIRIDLYFNKSINVIEIYFFSTAHFITPQREKVAVLCPSKKKAKVMSPGGECSARQEPGDHQGGRRPSQGKRMWGCRISSSGHINNGVASSINLDPAIHQFPPLLFCSRYAEQGWGRGFVTENTFIGNTGRMHILPIK